MEKVKKKLQSRGGVTILFALLGFLAAAMVSIVIVTAAISAARRVENDRAVTQDHLTLESAAQLVRDQMTGEVSADAKTTVTKTTSTSGVSYTSSGTFKDEMSAAVQYIDTYGANYESRTHAIEVATSDFDTVYVSYVMQTADAADSGGEYYLIFTFSLDDSSEELYLTMNGSQQVDKTNSKKTTISWENVSINGLGGSSGS